MLFFVDVHFFIMDEYSFQKKIMLLLLKVFFIALLFLSTQSFAQDNTIEYKIKAGYLYNFTKFISWPDDESETFNLCILGKDPFGSIINPIEAKSVKNKPIRLIYYQAVKDIKACHIIYFGETATKPELSELSLNAILSISSFDNSLTVGETEYFTHSGGMIAFILRQGKVKFQINMQALRKSGLEVRAKLLEVAEIYQGGSND